MEVYMYQAALYCRDCGKQIRQELDSAGKAPTDVNNEHSFDSDDYPKGPYLNGGGEADCPRHCDSCGLFLENPLTSDGYKYVAETIENGSVPEEWLEYYGPEI